MQRLHRLSESMAVPQSGPCRFLSNRVIVAVGGHIWPDNKKTMKPSLNFSAELVPVAYAAALLGWEIVPVAIEGQMLRHCLGLDRSEDFPPSRFAFTETGNVYAVSDFAYSFFKAFIHFLSG